MPFRLDCRNGMIDNRVRVPGGTAAVSAEAFFRAKAGHWVILRRRKKLMMREPEDLLEAYALPKE